MNNQLIKFEGNAVILPADQKWKIFSVFEPRKTIIDTKLDFSNFDVCIHKGQVREGMHLFELRSDEYVTMAYCMIVQCPNVLKA